MIQIWLVMIILGLLTFAIRLSFILLHGRWQPPQAMTRALRYVPVAALTAIFIPEILMHDGVIQIGLFNPRLLAGLAAIVVAWRTRSALWTIAVGMGMFWLLTLAAQFFVRL